MEAESHASMRELLGNGVAIMSIMGSVRLVSEQSV